MDTSSSRRRFLQTLGLASGAIAAGGLITPARAQESAAGQIVVPNPDMIGPSTDWTPRPAGSKYMGGFRAPKLDVVKVAFVGVAVEFERVGQEVVDVDKSAVGVVAVGLHVGVLPDEVVAKK